MAESKVNVNVSNETVHITINTIPEGPPGKPGPAGPPGPQGESGVRIDKVEPTDPNVLAWINPDGEPDSESGTVDMGDNWLMPERFGAVGDGVTDDTEALQAAIDYLAANNGGVLRLAGQYAVRELHFNNIHYSTTLWGSGRSKSCCALLYQGKDYCINVHGCTHLFFRDFCIYADNEEMSENNGAIRYYDRFSDVEYPDGDTYCRTNDSIINNMLISGFKYGVAVDSPCGYITVNETLIESVQSGGHAVSIGKYYNVAHLNSGQYTVNPNYIYINKVYVNGNEYSAPGDAPLAAAIGIYRANHVHITECDLCNIATGNAVYIDDSKGWATAIYLERNSFYNVRNAVHVELAANDPAVRVSNIHSRNNYYLLGNYTDCVPITIHGNSARTVYGISSIGDWFEVGAAGSIKYLYDIEYARSVRISDYVLTPTTADVANLWDTALYHFAKVTGIYGVKTKTFDVNATTAANGTIVIPMAYRLWNTTPYALTNVRDSANVTYNITVAALNDDSVTIRVRNSDGSAVAETAVVATVTLIGS